MRITSDIFVDKCLINQQRKFTNILGLVYVINLTI